MNKIELCRHYAQHCLEEAQKISDNIWMMNARIFLGQIEGMFNKLTLTDSSSVN